MSVNKTRSGDMCVTTRVLPGTDPGTALLSSDRTPTLQSWTTVATQQMKKLHTKSLGTLLILIGVLQLSCGATMSLAEGDQPSLTVCSGVYIWGGLVVIVAGCVTVAVDMKETITLVRACLGCHVTNAVLGGVGLILLAVQLYIETESCWVQLPEPYRNECVSISSGQLEPQPQPEEHYYHYTEHNYTAVLRTHYQSSKDDYMSS
ncbi:membrane-spanning 4-domains subfamily A member 4A-like [Ascaphus truei]|uniref:membrane-spanning 4-domains subfamily A member 4A-like n=1 Tax=Ascaphus truei TaxID=8439 RepID=UPI003F5A36C6